MLKNYEIFSKCPSLTMTKSSTLHILVSGVQFLRNDSIAVQDSATSKNSQSHVIDDVKGTSVNDSLFELN